MLSLLGRFHKSNFHLSNMLSRKRRLFVSWIQNGHLRTLTGSTSGTIWRKAEWISWRMESLRKSQGQNPRGHRPWGFCPRDFPRDRLTMIHPRLFHTFSFFFHPGLVKRDFFHWVQTQHLPREYYSQFAGHGFSILIELNPNIPGLHRESKQQDILSKEDAQNWAIEKLPEAISSL